ncbi:hypothetical protein AVEN_54412-1 [Araneus ventricosus]|uniref:Histone-lysine N-methyltransferase SETMAR n=1 Tax=Araneus ventricosus TaxID=182803 RepID=A0A4Y2D9E8_ARAVE|nr:hypothetical protein AVEN_54412-1 [Araneus ventricosus]
MARTLSSCGETGRVHVLSKCKVSPSKVFLTLIILSFLNLRLSFSSSWRLSGHAFKVGLWKTVNAAVSCQTLRKLRRAIVTSGVVPIHNNTRPHNAVVTQQLLEQFKWDMSDHPACSPRFSDD